MPRKVDNHNYREVLEWIGGSMRAANPELGEGYGINPWGSNYPELKHTPDVIYPMVHIERIENRILKNIHDYRESVLDSIRKLIDDPLEVLGKFNSMSPSTTLSLRTDEDREVAFQQVVRDYLTRSESTKLGHLGEHFIEPILSDTPNRFDLMDKYMFKEDVSIYDRVRNACYSIQCKSGPDCSNHDSEKEYLRRFVCNRDRMRRILGARMDGVEVIGIFLHVYGNLDNELDTYEGIPYLRVLGQQAWTLITNGNTEFYYQYRELFEVEQPEYKPRHDDYMRRLAKRMNQLLQSRDLSRIDEIISANMRLPNAVRLNDFCDIARRRNGT